MYPQPEPNVRRKKHFRARGSRGGSRRKKQLAAQTQAQAKAQAQAQAQAQTQAQAQSQSQAQAQSQAQSQAQAQAQAQAHAHAQAHAQEQAKQGHFYEQQHLHHHQYLVKQQIRHQQHIHPARHSNLKEIKYLHAPEVQTYRERAMKLPNYDLNINSESCSSMPPPLVMSTSSSSNSEWSAACENEEEHTPLERYIQGIETLLSNGSHSQMDGRDLSTVSTFTAESQFPCFPGATGEMDIHTHALASNNADCNNHTNSTETRERTFETKCAWPFAAGQTSRTSLFITSPKSFLMGKYKISAIEKQRLDFS
uniref:Uncharacterized protein n=1 Tax=Chaetoceros debilis TaxID=122233 RepID=A0A6S8WTT5_9STRA